MQFTLRKRRSPPTVIIVSLIDVLIVVLIFLMVTTTFKKQPAFKLTLPQSREAQPGGSSNKGVTVSILKSGEIDLDSLPVTREALVQRLTLIAKTNPDVSLKIWADSNAPWGRMVNVLDAAKEAKIQNVEAPVQHGAGP
jgi:biopolymer transport protein ExbD